LLPAHLLKRAPARLFGLVGGRAGGCPTFAVGPPTTRQDLPTTHSGGRASWPA